MTFEYRDDYGRVLTVAHGLDDDDNPMAVLWARGEYSTNVPVRVPAARVEEVVAGIRDAARQTGQQPDTAATNDCPNGAVIEFPGDVPARVVISACLAASA